MYERFCHNRKERLSATLAVQDAYRMAAALEPYWRAAVALLVPEVDPPTVVGATFGVSQIAP